MADPVQFNNYHSNFYEILNLYFSLVSVPEEPDFDNSVCKTNSSIRFDCFCDKGRSAKILKYKELRYTKTVITPQKTHHPNPHSVLKHNTEITSLLLWSSYSLTLYKAYNTPRKLINHNVQSPTICKYMGSHYTVTKDLYFVYRGLKMTL